MELLMAIIEIRLESVILKDNQLLLGKHIKNNKHYWVLPGGHLEFGEKLSDALLREMNEELNINYVDNIKQLYTNEYIDKEKNRHVLNIGYKLTVPGETIRRIKLNTHEEALAEIRYFSKKDILSSEETFYPSKNFIITLFDN